jgi:hypothetical protein
VSTLKAGHKHAAGAVLSRTLLLAVVFLSTGCFHARDAAVIRSEIVRQQPDATLKRDISLNIGTVPLGLAGFVLAFVPGKEVGLVQRHLSSLTRVQVGVYEVRTMTAAPVQLEYVQRMQRNGWDLVARFTEEGEHIWFLIREKRDKLREIFVVVLDDERLVVLRARGDLDEMVQDLLQQWQERKS